MKKRVGLITIGCRENRPNWADLIARLEPEVEVDFTGVLDGLTREEIEREFAFVPGENYLVTEVPWASSIQLREETAKKYMLRRAEEHFANGVDTVLVLCTGDFDRPHADGTLFLLPEDLLYGILSGLRQERLGFIVPEPDQIPFSRKQYASLNPIIKASSPYGSMEDLAKTAAQFKDEPVDVIVTDCMGFTAEMGQIVARESGKQVLVPRLVLPKLIKALLIQE